MAVLGLACSGPDLHPTAVSEPTGPMYNPVVPDNGICAPNTVRSEEALRELSSDAAPPAGPEQCPDITPSTHTPLRPLGIGYQQGTEPIPEKTAYLTFDDGPSEWTVDFLNILEEKGVKATFFVTAKQLKGEKGLEGTYIDISGRSVVFGDLLKRIVDDGHQLANHTVNHPDIARITRAQMSSEIEQNELLVNRALVRAGSPPQLLTLFRPPYGSPWYTGLVADNTPPRASERISSHGLNIMWNITSTDAADWAVGESYSLTATPSPTEETPDYAVKVARIRDSVLASRQFAEGAGIIVLMHDTHDTTRDALPGIIDGLYDAGYTFDTIEHYVQWRWQRPSVDMTPGPNLYQACVDERNWGCASFGVPLGTDRALEVCGRMWLAYQGLGGEEVLGWPVAAPVTNPETNILSQEFESAVVELHPENEAPCNVVAVRK